MTPADDIFFLDLCWRLVNDFLWKLECCQKVSPPDLIFEVILPTGKPVWKY